MIFSGPRSDGQIMKEYSVYRCGMESPNLIGLGHTVLIVPRQSLRAYIDNLIRPSEFLYPGQCVEDHLLIYSGLGKPHSV
jgi:hypothetical protein